MIRGIGTALALPCLEAMLPQAGFGAITAPTIPGPKRLAWFYVPNGVNMATWRPTTMGAGYELPPTFKSIAAFKDKFNIISGLTALKANPNGDGPGDHARAQAAYLTGCQPVKSEGANIHLGISADQAAATKMGILTKFPSLELGMEEGASAGKCDSGYSCAYQHNLSWRNETTPVGKDCSAQSVFDRMFSNGDPNESAAARVRRTEKRKSILDFVASDATSLQNKLGTTDKRKLDEYFSSIREIETRMEKAAASPQVELPPGVVRPSALGANAKANGVATNSTTYDARMPLMLDMMVLAFQTDSTRIVTFPFADEESNQSYPWADAPVPHHGTSHHNGDLSKIAYLSKINAYHIKWIAYLLTKLDNIQEGNGSILDNSLMAFGSGNSDGQRHNHDDLPTLLIGRAGGTVKGGRHLDFEGAPITNLWLAMLEHAGAPWGKPLGDSTGTLSLA
jgi:hypothetical protein